MSLIKEWLNKQTRDALEAQRDKINARSRFRKYKDNQAYDRDLIQKIDNLIEAYADYEEDL